MLPALNHYLSDKMTRPKWWQPVCLLAAGLSPIMSHAQNGGIEPQVQPPAEQAPNDTEKPLQTVERTSPGWPDIVKSRKNLLAESTLSDNSVWLDRDTRTILAFWYPHSGTTAKGSILMLHAAGQHPVWPETLKNIIEHLPPHGWSILTLAVPDYFEPPAPRPATTSVPTASEPATDPASAPTEGTAQETQSARPLPMTRQAIDEQVTINMEAGLTFLREQGFTSTVLLGEGLGAKRVMNFRPDVTANGVTVVAKLLLNYPDNLDSSNSVTDYSQLLEEIPTLDIYFDNFGLAERAARSRAANARAAPGARYRQTKFSAWAAPTDPGQENRLTKTIRGFLKTHQVANTPDR